MAITRTRTSAASITVDVGNASFLKTAYSGAAVSIPDHVVVVQCTVADEANPFGTGASLNSLVRATNDAAQIAWDISMSPTAGGGAGAIRWDCPSPAKQIPISQVGDTNGNFYRGKRLTIAVTFRTRVPRLYIITDDGTFTATSSAFSAGAGTRACDNLIHGHRTSNLAWPGAVSLFAVWSGTLGADQAAEQALIEEIHAKNDPSWTLEKYKAQINAAGYADNYLMRTSAFSADGSIPRTGQSVTAHNFGVYDSADATPLWFGQSTSGAAVTVTPSGTQTFVRPTEIGYVVRPDLVADGGLTIDTVAMSVAPNPTLLALARAANGITSLSKLKLVAIRSNSRGARNVFDAEFPPTQNATYHSTQQQALANSYAGALSHLLESELVGAFRPPQFAGSRLAHVGGTYGNVIPSTGTITQQTGAGANDPAVDFTRAGMFCTAEPNTGSGSHLEIAASGGAFLPFAAFGDIQPTDRIRVGVMVMKYPGAATVTVQKGSDASSSSTVPFSTANYASVTTHGSASGPHVLSTSTVGMSGTVVSYSAGTPSLTVGFLSTVPPDGHALVVSRGGVPCIGISTGWSFSSPNTTFTLSHTMGAGTGVPQVGDTWSGGPLLYEWHWQDFDGTETPNPWRGLVVTAGASGFPVRVMMTACYKIDVSGNPVAGVMVAPQGDGGDGYNTQISKQFNTVGNDGYSPLQRYHRSLFEIAADYPSLVDRLVILSSADQNSDESHLSTVIDDYFAAGFDPEEVAYCSQTVYGNNNALATYSQQLWGADEEVGAVCRTKGIVGISVWPEQGTHLQAMVHAYRNDNSHNGNFGQIDTVNRWLRAALPESEGGDGAVEIEPVSSSDTVSGTRVERIGRLSRTAR